MIDTSRNTLQYISNLNRETQRISYQMGTGKNQQYGSEDSLLHANIIQIEEQLRVTQNLKLQIVKTNAVNDTSDSSFQEMKNLLDKIKVDIMKGLNDGMDRDDKLALATNLKGIRENMFDLATVQVDGEHIFSGSVTTKETFIKDPDYESNGQIHYNGDAFLRKIAVQPGSYRERGVTGYDVAFYTANSAISSERLSFDANERIIDSEGHEWKMSADATKLQRYDHNGAIYHPPVELNIGRENSESTRIDLGMDANTNANGDYTITIAGAPGSPYTYTAVNADAATIFADLRTQIEADGYSVSTSLDDNDKFYITSTTPINVNITNTDPSYISIANNEEEATLSQQAQQASYYVDIPNSITTSSGEEIDLRHIKFESKHNYFDDLNIAINALEGYSTKLDGSKAQIINDALVDETLRTSLGQTTDQFDATNIGHGELGGRNNVFNIAYDKLISQETHYNVLLAETSGADMTKLALESKTLELTYTALYSTITRMNELSLVNFIR